MKTNSSQSNSKVSVIVPVYNASRYLNDCIESILSQDYKDIELILINDGSTDDSLSIIQFYQKTDNRVVLIDQINQGVSAARNAGIEKSTGQFLCFCDADDLIERDFVSSMISCIGECDACFGSHKFLYEDGTTLVKEQRIAENIYNRSTLASRIIDDGTLTGILFGSVWGAIYNSDFIKNNSISFIETIRVNEDGLFNLAIIDKAHSVKVCSLSKYCYRQWKDAKKVELSFDTSEFNKANEALLSSFGHFSDFELQYRRRLVSIAFWVSLRVGRSKKSVIYCAGKLREYHKNKIVNKNYRFLSFKTMNKYKRVLIFLLKHKMFMLFSFFIKKIVPVFSNRLRH